MTRLCIPSWELRIPAGAQQGGLSGTDEQSHTCMLPTSPRPTQALEGDGRRLNAASLLANPDAVFSADDFGAVGPCKQQTNLGISVPTQFGLVMK